MSERRCTACGAALVVGSYTVVQVLARNAKGRVYVVRTEGGSRLVLKEVVFSIVPDAQQIEAFLREGDVLRRLAHPQIPHFVDRFTEGSGVHTRLYLAQEFIEGETLLARAERQPFDEAEAIRIARQVLRILEYLHAPERRLLHRDLKPSNLIVDRRQSLWLVDFGAARLVERGVTHGATLVGTYGYMPLEQMGGTVDESSDLYALGATLVHLVSGRAPSEMLRDGVTLDFERFVNLSPVLGTFLTRLTAQDRSRRPRTATDALELLAALERSPPRAWRTKRSSRPGQWKKRLPGVRAGIIRAAAVIGIAAVIGGAMYGLRPIVGPFLDWAMTPAPTGSPLWSEADASAVTFDLRPSESEVFERSVSYTDFRGNVTYGTAEISLVKLEPGWTPLDVGTRQRRMLWLTVVVRHTKREEFLLSNVRSLVLVLRDEAGGVHSTGAGAPMAPEPGMSCERSSDVKVSPTAACLIPYVFTLPEHTERVRLTMSLRDEALVSYAADLKARTLVRVTP